jgi:uncharacterized phage protein (TIGR01671 family)
MKDRFKFRYVFAKDFGGKTGICYKMPIFNLDTITDENFNKIVKSYIDYGYKLISIEQSTGLKDKNGKLIYEGDVIKVVTQPNIIENIGIVKWDNKSAQFLRTASITDENSLVSFWWNDTTEVIGNVYEHPELLSEVE